MNWVTELKQLLDDGLYLHNLRRMTECCERGLKEGQHVLPAYVLRSVIADLHREWEGRAVRVEEVRRSEARLRPALEAVVASLLAGQPVQALTTPLEALVRAWASL